jgi:hypothetical protein
MGKGIVFGCLMMLAAYVLTLLLGVWGAFAEVIAREHGVIIGTLVAVGPLAVFVVVLFAIIGHREGW